MAKGKGTGLGKFFNRERNEKSGDRGVVNKNWAWTS